MTNAATLASLAVSGALSADSSGNVGIGTSSPTAKLEVNGAIKGNGVTLSGYDVIGGGTTNYLSLYSNSGGPYIVIRGSTGGSQGIEFGTGGAERARIDSSGNLLVGRTNNPSGLSSSLYVTGAYSNTTPSGANVFVNTDGSFFRSTSSLKYKTDIQDYSRGLEDVAKLRPVFYKAKSGISTEQRFAGFIAEEIEAAGLTEFVQYAEDGSPDALSYGNMVSLCIKAIQELKAEVDQLRAQLEAK